MQGTKVVTFGGCHSEYHHLNDLNIFELAAFIQAPSSGIVVCTKVSVTENVPTTRWGHGATVLNDTKLFILGGRNDNDVNDLYCFDIEEMRWRQLEIGNPLPKPRRRHSCILISNCLVMFGGFDGEFYNDLNVLDLQPNFKKCVVSESTKDQDLNRLINNYEASDFKFVIEGAEANQSSVVHANKGLVLYNLCTKERNQTSINDKTTIPEFISDASCPEFIQRVFKLSKHDSIHLSSQLFCFNVERCRQAVLRLMGLLYTGKLQSVMTLEECSDVLAVSTSLGLKNTAHFICSQLQALKTKLNQRIMRDFQLKKYRVFSEITNVSGTFETLLDEACRENVREAQQQLEKTVKYNFGGSQMSTWKFIQSEEEQKDQAHLEAYECMALCGNLDQFYDMVFHVDNSFIKGNSTILKARSTYF